jgi:hypothetical protein
MLCALAQLSGASAAEPSSQGKIAPKPLYRDRIHDGAADPAIVFDRASGKWRMFYTNRRASSSGLSGVAWVHGTPIGMAESADGGATWNYLGEARIQDGTGVADPTYWAPDVIDDGNTYHMFLTLVPGVFEDWKHPRTILHLKSRDLTNWTDAKPLTLASDRVIDASIFRMPDKSWRLFYNNERDHKSIYYADSPDLENWTLKGKAVGDQGGEGPKAFRWKGRVWLITDVWKGLAVYRSDDATNWERQAWNLVQTPGLGLDDQVIGSHADVVVSGERAFLFYFTHPGRRGPDARKDGFEQRRSSIQVVELEYKDGWLVCDRNSPTRIRLTREADPMLDRHAIVTRHNIRIHDLSSLEFKPSGDKDAPHEAGADKRYTPLQVGNGEFAFSADVTGLQTFIPCNTLSNWGWHSSPLPAGLKAEDFRWVEFDSDHGRKIPFPFVTLNQDTQYKGSRIEQNAEQKKLAEWLRANPHRLNLGRIALSITRADGSAFRLEDLKDIDQTLNLWTGVLSSRFSIEGVPVSVETLAHPANDAVAVRIESPLIPLGRLKVTLRFPYGDSRGNAADVGDWARTDAHSSTLVPVSSNESLIERSLDAERYWVRVTWDTKAALSELRVHEFELRPATSENSLAFVCDFTPRPPAPKAASDFAASKALSISHWSEFWHSGAAIDFSACTDPRASELERRVVLSQYLLAVQEAGSLPPQEAGLVNNGWYGKFHLEMYLWHSAHYALWNRDALLERSLGYYARIADEARALAARQGFTGLRWPKMVGPEGRQSPSSIAPFLIWQQPHPLFFAELEYRAQPTRATLEKWQSLVFGTADFMASLPVYDARDGYFHLGAPLKTVPENTRLETTRDPAFELAYWRLGLRIAQSWRERLGMPREDKWDCLLQKLAPLPAKDGLYLLSATQPDSYENYHWEHPSLAGVYGLLPGDGTDLAAVRRTLDAVLEKWDMKRVWGWDFPMLALCAARLGETDRAVDLLLTDSPNFQFAPNGFASGGPWPYFPSNGSLLYAVAFMAGGWDGAPEQVAPGFPQGKGWAIRCEGFAKAP